MTLLVKTCSDLLITELTATPAVHFSKLKQLPLTCTDLQVLFLLAQHCMPGLHGEILPGLHSETDYKGRRGWGVQNKHSSLLSSVSLAEQWPKATHHAYT